MSCWRWSIGASAPPPAPIRCCASSFWHSSAIRGSRRPALRRATSAFLVASVRLVFLVVAFLVVVAGSEGRATVLRHSRAHRHLDDAVRGQVRALRWLFLFFFRRLLGLDFLFCLDPLEIREEPFA